MNVVTYRLLVLLFSVLLACGCTTNTYRSHTEIKYDDASAELMALKGQRVQIKNFYTGNYLTKRGEDIVLSPRKASFDGSQTFILEHVYDGNKTPLFVLIEEAGSDRAVRSGEAFKLKSNRDTSNFWQVVRVKIGDQFSPLLINKVILTKEQVRTPGIWMEKDGKLTLAHLKSIDGAGLQQWEIQAAPKRAAQLDTSIEYVLRSRYNGKALDTDGSDVYYWTMHGENIQRWKLAYDEGRDGYTIWNVDKKKFATVERDSGYKLRLGNSNAADAQSFEFVPVDKTNPYSGYRIRPISAPGPASSSYLAIGTEAQEYFKDGGKIGLSKGSKELDIWELLPAKDIDMFKEKDARVAFLQEGGYLANYYVYYDGKWQHEVKNVPLQQLTDFKAGKTEGIPTFTVPARAKDVRVRGAVGFAGGNAKNIFDINVGELGSSGYYCIKSYGTAFSPQHNNNCSVFGSKAIHVYNSTNDDIYVGWTDEITWSFSNVLGGVILGLVQDNAQNFNSSFFRYFAIANALELDLPEPAYDFFKSFSTAIPRSEYMKILEFNPWGMAGNAFKLARIKDKKGAAKFFVEWAKETAEQSPEYQARYVQYNPIIALGDQLGGETKTIMIVNASKNRFWIMDTGIDDSWIIRENDIIRAKHGTLQVDPGGKTEKAIKLSFD